jgi:hypothetical protein
LAFDLKNLGTRNFRTNFFLVLACAAGVFFIPDRHPGYLNVHIVADNQYCPDFCKYDIVSFSPNLRAEREVAAGDRVIVLLPGPEFIVAKILAVRKQQACAANGRSALVYPADTFSCSSNPGLYPYVISNAGHHKNRQLGTKSLPTRQIMQAQIFGTTPIVIGNTHKYNFTSERLTEVVSNMFWNIYKWTGFDFLGFVKPANN